MIATTAVADNLSRCSSSTLECADGLSKLESSILVRLAHRQGPMLEVMKYLDTLDVLQMRACDKTLHQILTVGLYDDFWTKRCSRGYLQVAHSFRMLSDTSYDHEFYNFSEFHWSMRFRNRFSTRAASFRIKVCARFRPNKSSETNSCPPFINDSLILSSPQSLLCPKKSRQWTLDRVLPPNSHTEKVYLEVAGRRVQDLLCGLNGCVLAYGQTGSGKSHTIIGNGRVFNGILPVSIMKILKFITSSNIRGVLAISACEVYQEKSRTLLHTEKLENHYDMERALKLIQAKRKTGSTAMNERSSRSHCLFTLHLWQAIYSKWIGSELKIVDLAGSERLKRAHLDGCVGETTCSERIHEGISINLSLSCLSRVINSLVNGANHIPFNDSLLTRMLRSALGGDQKASATLTILCCCSSDEEDLSETLSTLRFAEQASSIRLVCPRASPKEFRSLVEFQTKLETIEIEMEKLQCAWTRAGEDRHNIFCRCNRCKQVVDEGGNSSGALSVQAN